MDAEVHDGLSGEVGTAFDGDASYGLGEVQLDVIGGDEGVPGNIGHPEVDLPFAVVALGELPVVDRLHAHGHIEGLGEGGLVGDLHLGHVVVVRVAEGEGYHVLRGVAAALVDDYLAHGWEGIVDDVVGGG